MIPSHEKPPDPFVLFVRAREGRIVRRFGTPYQIGYRYAPSQGTPATFDEKGRVTKPAQETSPAQHFWDTETIHAIPAVEYEAHRKEYGHELVEGGGLVEVTRREWEAQRAERKAAAQDIRAKASAEAAKTEPAASAEGES